MNMNKSLLAMLVAGGCLAAQPGMAADSLTVFKAGDVIKSADMNGNFTYLENMINSAKANKGLVEDSVDCSADPNALVKYFEAPTQSRFTKLTLTGACNGDPQQDGELLVTRDNIWIEGGEIAAPVLVRGKTDVSLSQVTISTNKARAFWTDGGGSVYLDRVVLPAQADLVVTGNSALAFNSDIGGKMLVANQASRLFLFSPAQKARHIYLDNSASMEFTSLNTASIEVANGASLHGKTMTADNVYLNNGASAQLETLTVNGPLDLKAASALNAVTVTADEFSVKLSSAMKVSGDLTANSGDVIYSSSMRAKGNAAVKQFSVRAASTARVDNTFTVDNLEINQGSFQRADTLNVSDKIFARQASLAVDKAITYNTVDVGSFSEMVIYMPITQMCSDFNRVNVSGWSHQDHKSFPFDCQ